MADLFGQGDFGVRLDWGVAGAGATQADVAVVVDVLSFSTAVTVAVERGMRLFPYRWAGEQARQFAAAQDAVLAVGRREGTTCGAVPAPSLSPAALVACQVVPRLVLPSPNGSTIAAILLEGDSTVVAGCLRNAQAVAEWLVPTIESGRPVAVIAAGERWGDDGSLRPALEDHLGAGAILAALVELGLGDECSPEALAAADIFNAGRDVIHRRIHDCVSGKELNTRGFTRDVDIAADLNASTIVPVLVSEAFGPADPT